MKKVLTSLFSAALLISCLDETPDGKDIVQDIYLLTRENTELTVAGKFYTGETLSDATLSMTILNGFGREVIISAETVDGIGIAPTPVQLKAGGAMNDVTVPITGTISRTTPGTIDLTLDIEYGQGQHLRRIFRVEVFLRPAFGLEMDGEYVKVNSSTYNSLYGYSVLGAAPYDSQNPAVISMNYEGGASRSITLDNYEIEQIAGETADVSLELESGTLSEEEGTIRLLLRGEIPSHATFLIRNFEFTVGGALKVNASTGANFPEMKLRLFDIMHTHIVGYDASYTTPITETYGYDEVKVTVIGGDNIPRTCTWLDPMLGSVQTEGSEEPFLYQWGRAEDGHQIGYPTPKANKSATLSKTADGWDDSPEKIRGRYILVASQPDSWQTSPSIDDQLWDTSPTGGVNNPCPEGYRVPSSEELGPTAFNLAQDFTYVGGNRVGNTDVIAKNPVIYTCTPVTGNAAQAYGYNCNTKKISPMPRSNGYPIRCIKIE